MLPGTHASLIIVLFDVVEAMLNQFKTTTLPYNLNMLLHNLIQANLQDIHLFIRSISA